MLLLVVTFRYWADCLFVWGSVVLATSLRGLALDFPLGESFLDPPPCHLVLNLGEHVGLIESGSGADGVMVLAGGAKAMTFYGVGTVVEVTCRLLSTYVGMS